MDTVKDRAGAGAPMPVPPSPPKTDGPGREPAKTRDYTATRNRTGTRRMTRREDPGKGVGMNVFCQAESALPRSGDLPVWNAETVRREFRAAAGSGQGGSIVGEWKDGHEQMPPVGWKVRDGQVLGNVSAKCPELRAHLERPENAWKLKTEAEWQAPSRAAGGVDGA